MAYERVCHNGANARVYPTFRMNSHTGHFDRMTLIEHLCLVLEVIDHGNSCS